MVIRAENTSFKKDFSVSGNAEERKGAPTRKQMGVMDEQAQAAAVQKTMEELDKGTTILQAQLALNVKGNYPDKGTGGMRALRHLSIGALRSAQQFADKLYSLEMGTGHGNQSDGEELKRHLGDIIVQAILLIDELDASAEDVVNRAVNRL